MTHDEAYRAFERRWAAVCLANNETHHGGHPPSPRAQEAVARIVVDLCDRGGLKHAWHAFDEETRFAIATTWARLIDGATGDSA